MTAILETAVGREPLTTNQQCNFDSKSHHYDVLIVGAGMVGLALAAALGQTSLRVGLIEAKTIGGKNNPVDSRASAIALGSIYLLNQIGAWKSMQAMGVCPIHQVEISDQGFPWVATLRREDIHVEALGYVVENWITETALQQVLSRCTDVQWFRPATVQAIVPKTDYMQVVLEQDRQRHLSTQLLVGADGGQSWVRQQANIPVAGWDYNQVLIVCTITTESPHFQTGYERFHASGPFAILPMCGSATTHRCCIVWTAKAHEKETLMALDDAAFIEAIAPRISPELGRILSVSPRACYFPRRQHVDRYVASRLALIGDAAHTTHPIGGQGLNMGLRDVATLAFLVTQAHIQGNDLGNSALLEAYQHQRRIDNETVLLGTDLANRLFSNTLLPLQLFRRLGLLGIDWTPPLKRIFIEYGMGRSQHLFPFASVSML